MIIENIHLGQAIERAFNEVYEKGNDDFRKEELTQMKFAELLGVTRSYVRKIFNNHDVGAKRLHKISRILGKDLTVLIRPDIEEVNELILYLNNN